MDLRKYINESEIAANQPVTGDEFDFTINETYNIESEVLEHEDGAVIVAVDEKTMSILEHIGAFNEEMDKSSGSPYDRGGADAYYGRKFNPHKMVPNPKDPRGRIQQPVTDPAEIAAYEAGWNDEDGRKDYGESEDLSEVPVMEDIVQHSTHGAVYGKDGKAKLFMTRGEATAVADAMAKKHGSSGVSVVQGPYTGYMVKMPEGVTEDDPLQGRIGLNIVNKKPRSGQTDLSNIPVGNLPAHMKGADRDFSSDYVKSHPDRLKANIKKSLGKHKEPNLPEDIEQTDEAGMPSGVIRSKQRMAEYTPEQMLAKYKEVAGRFGEATPAAIEKLAREEAWRHGYGRMSDHYWKQFKHLVGESVNEVGDTKLGQKKLNKVFNRANKQSSDAWKKMDFEKGEKRGKVADLAYDRINDREMAYDRLKEAEYQGRSVQLGKPTRGDVKKYKVYVRDPKSGNIKKVNFGDKNMEIKRDNPERRKNFRARHNCSDKKDRTKAGYWSCRMWSKKPVSKIV